MLNGFIKSASLNIEWTILQNESVVTEWEETFQQAHS
jgi:hypothetical protein